MQCLQCIDAYDRVTGRAHLGMAVKVSGWSIAQSTLWATPLAYFRKKCVKRILTIRINGDWETRGQPTYPGLRGKWPLEMVCVFCTRDY